MNPNEIDATRIASKLYQGSMPLPWTKLKSCGFDALVLCAVEWQPSQKCYDVPVIHAPFYDDGTLNQEMWEIANQAAKIVSDLVSSGKRVLTTCAAGRNRSGLVNALALIRLTGCSGGRAVAEIRFKRNLALSNKAFVTALSTIQGIDE